MNIAPECVADNLAGYLRSHFGSVPNLKVFAAPDPVKGMELLSAGTPGGRTIVVFYESDSPADPDGPAGDTMVTARLSVAVTGHPGLHAIESRNTPDMLAFAGEVRAAITADTPDGIFGGYRYTGMSYVRDNQGTLMIGYALSFEATYAYLI